MVGKKGSKDVSNVVPRLLLPHSVRSTMATTATAPTFSSAQTYSAAKTFDEVGPAYEDAFRDLQAQHASIEWLLSELTQYGPAKVLDIGCGTGRPICSSLAQAGHSVTGIDVSGAMLAAARERVPKAKFEQIDVREFSTPESSFHAITAYFSFIAGVTQDDIRDSFKRIYTWLKPGGLFVFATVPMNGNCLAINWMGRPIVVSSFATEDILATLKKVGFEIVYEAASTFNPKAVEAGICKAEDTWEEPHFFLYARKT